MGVDERRIPCRAKGEGCPSGLGILQAQFCSPLVFRQEIRRVRALTARPFGVNLLLHFPVEDQVAICLEERVPVLSLFWGDPTPYVGLPAGSSGG